MTRGTTSAADAAVADYLDDLQEALILVGAPRARRRELIADIQAHIADSRTELDDPWSEPGVRTILERLGDPELIAAEEAPAAPAAIPPAAPVREPAWRAPATIVLLLLGGFAFASAGSPA